MAARLQLTLATVLGLVALALAGVLVFSGGGSSSARTATSVNGFVGYERSPDIPPGDFTLRDQDGKRVSLRALRGQDVILTFLYSTCQDTCPVTASTIRGALDDVGHDVPVLAVSVDPKNDTPDNAKRFINKQGLTGRMHFLLGTRAQLQPVWKAYGIRPQGNGYEHSAYVLLIDRRGRQRISFPQSDLTPEGLAHDLRRLDASRS